MVNLLLLTILCADRCQSGCQSYSTPFQQCFSAHELFPDDPSWSDVDILDIFPSTTNHISDINVDDLNHKDAADQEEFVRFFYSSTNGTCSGKPTDSFVLPFDECVGPFGAPRPWGNFSLVANTTMAEQQ